ncbi:protein kinase [Alteromonas sp. 1_MG-2023]|uniref:bifunctional protein-serine/threonine kinase/phosphatase n=1 Tax=Alteromonas sp. 1_MG-2023 TaxID=3062669 RepID=UPI0026E48F2C|nr:bifunctional protein-serine/threonine kinase/phosphatase [Alteromonas sp. 1_MG-2023]MDO6567416.1 protein kinase [Alteromonas sp. 1_MG-2023]
MQTNTLSVHYSEFTDSGVKPVNQDACSGYIPSDTSLTLKGCAFALADGISSSTVSQIASDLAISDFASQYYCTSETWSVAQSAKTVIQGINATLYAKTQQSPFCYTPDKGYVCTFSAVIIKGDTAHIFHVGDARVCLFRNGHCEILTESHRVEYSQHESYLANALGVQANVDIDYLALPLEENDTLVLMTDGVYEFVSPTAINEHIEKNSLGQSDNSLERIDCPERINSLEPEQNTPESELNTSDTRSSALAKQIVQLALANGSNDNVTFQSITIKQLDSNKFSPDADSTLPLPDGISVGDEIDGYVIERQLYQSARSHVYQAKDTASLARVVIKVPSTELALNDDYLEHFALEEWIARRINSEHVIRAPKRAQSPQYNYCINEYLEGRNLSQWLIDNPKPSIEKVRDIIEQVAKGLMAMHREDILHQDIRPENIMIEESGNCKIIDLGSARVAGISELSFHNECEIMGTAAYVAPEYFLGDSGCDQSDLYSLAVLTYYLLSGRFPYGTQVAKSRTVAAQHKLKYQSVLDERQQIPAWIDATLKRALQPNPDKRYSTLSEFIFNLRQPSPAFLNRVTAPLIERYPLRFWQGLSLLLAISNIATFLLFYRSD